jgi:hypothetical protein
MLAMDFLRISSVQPRLTYFLIQAKAGMGAKGLIG